MTTLSFVRHRYSVTRGPLLFSLPITPNYTVAAHHYGLGSMSNDHELRPRSVRWPHVWVQGPAGTAMVLCVRRRTCRGPALGACPPPRVAELTQLI